MNNKTVLLTGSSGFLGSYIKKSLTDAGFEVVSLGRRNSDIINDLGTEIPHLPSNIDFVVHAAGKAHLVPKTQKESDLFYTVNHTGTQKLLEGLKRSGSPVKGIVLISTVAVYGLTEGKNIAETENLNASDPYGKSKILAEKVVEDFCKLQNINACILRLPLIAGKNAPGNLGAMVRVIKKGWYLSIGKADNKKSMVMANDVAQLIPHLFGVNGIYHLTDGAHPTFGQLEKSISKVLGKNKPVKIPQFMARLMAKTGDLIGKRAPINSNKLKKMQSELTFSDAKAIAELNWKPGKVLDHVDQLI